MNFDLSDEHRALRDTVREFAESVIAPVAEELDRESRFPVDIVRQLGEMGLMGVPFDAELGGGGADTLAYAITIEELTRIDSSVGVTVAAHTSLGTSPIAMFGNEEQKARYLPDLCSGRRLAAFGLTEPGGGSDAGAHPHARGRAGRRLVGRRRREDVHHQRRHRAVRVVSITALTGDGEISNLIVENGTPGYEISAPLHKMGWHASDTRALSSQGCQVGPEALLGERGAGLKQFLQILDGGRISIAAMGLGLAQGALSSRCIREGAQPFGRPIAKFQAIQFKLADMATEIALRGTWSNAAWLKDQGRPFAQEAAMAKLFTGELADRAPTRRCRSTAATVTWRISRLAASSGIRRCPRSARAPARFSGWSSRAASASGSARPLGREAALLEQRQHLAGRARRRASRPSARPRCRSRTRRGPRGGGRCRRCSRGSRPAPRAAASGRPGRSGMRVVSTR